MKAVTVPPTTAEKIAALPEVRKFINSLIVKHRGESRAYFYRDTHAPVSVAKQLAKILGYPISGKLVGQVLRQFSISPFVPYEHGRPVSDRYEIHTVESRLTRSWSWQIVDISLGYIVSCHKSKWEAEEEVERLENEAVLEARASRLAYRARDNNAGDDDSQDDSQDDQDAGNDEIESEELAGCET